LGLFPTGQKLGRARQLEQQGHYEHAAHAYAEAQAYGDAARLLMHLRRYQEAGNMLMHLVGVAPGQVGTLNGERRNHASTAAACYLHGGQPRIAAEMYAALGDVTRAAHILEQTGDAAGAQQLRAQAFGQGGGSNPGMAAPGAWSGGSATNPGAGGTNPGNTNPGVPTTGSNRPVTATGASSGIPSGSSNPTVQRAAALEQQGDARGALELYIQSKQYVHAGRVAQQLGDYESASKYYLDAGKPYEAAICFHLLKDNGRCLDALIRVQRDDPRYRNAAVQAVELSSGLGLLEFAFEQFIDRFIEDVPADDRETEAFYKLAKLYQKHSHPEDAKDLLEKITERNPSYKDVPQLLQQLAQASDNPRVFERIVREEMQFKAEERRRSNRTTANLPNLPDLPDLPAVPMGNANATAYQPAAFSPLASNYGPQGGAPMPSGRDEPARTASGQSTQMGPPGGYNPSPYASYPPQPPGGSYPPQPPGGYAPPQQQQQPPPAPAPQPSSGGTPPSGNTSKPGGSTFPPSDKTGMESFVAGATIADRYLLEKRIGKGGMATVFKARDKELEIDIALKVFQQPIEDDEQLLHRFKQELVLSRQLTHQNIIRLYDIGIHNGHRYITMELLSGNELKAQLGKPLDVAVGIDYLVQACAGLQYAHDKGIVHRDVKPQNFFVTADNVLKVMDFGIAKRQDTQGMTVAGMIAGTPNYMSPEQINGFSTVTVSTDIYALGVIAFEMFTGDVPFSHPELMPLLMMHLTKPPPSPRAANPGLPTELEGVVLKLMEKDPARRYPSCRALAEELERIRRALGV
jgi:tetratricopeptide (TPR) repeat protein